MIKKIPLTHLLFLDIETVPENSCYEELPQEKQKLWAKKTQYQRKEDFGPEEF